MRETALEEGNVYISTYLPKTNQKRAHVTNDNVRQCRLQNVDYSH